VFLLIIFIVFVCACSGYKMAGRPRRRKRLLPGGGFGTEEFPMRHSPNIYVGPPRGTGYEPYYNIPLPPSYGYDGYGYGYGYPWMTNLYGYGRQRYVFPYPYFY